MAAAARYAGVMRYADGGGLTAQELSAAQVRELDAVLDAGPACWGWEDQCWMLARIAELVRRRFGVQYTLAGLDLLLHRIGWSVQVPARLVALASVAEDSWRSGMDRAGLAVRDPADGVFPDLQVT